MPNAEPRVGTPVDPTNSSDVDWRVGRAVVIVFAVSISLAGVLWGVAYVLLGAPGAALYPFGFAVVTALNGLVFRFTRRLRLAALIEVVAILVVPMLLSLHLGGFASSGAIPLWASLAPIGSMLFLGPAAALVSFLGFAFVAIATVVADGGPAAASIGTAAREAFTVVNVVAVTAVAAASTFRFTAMIVEVRRQQAKVRELERAYLSQDLLLRQQERLAQLGKLSAGVAHELNNPASAVARASDLLQETLDALHAGRDASSPDGVDAHVFQALASARGPGVVDQLELSERSDALASWLSPHDPETAWDLAPELAEAGLEPSVLDRIAQRFGAQATAASIVRQGRHVRAWRLAEDIRTGARRISSVVDALKGYSDMDRSAEHSMDVAAGLEDTLAVLRHRLRGVRIEREVDADLPPIVRSAGELNQVWTHLIENAADALGGKGRLTVRARSTPTAIEVQIEDDGPGIAPGMIESVFDPFVTTKAPGEGTGLGLYRAYRTVRDRLGGTLGVSSRPGCTCFTVVLPIEVAAAAPG